MVIHIGLHFMIKKRVKNPRKQTQLKVASKPIFDTIILKASKPLRVNSQK